MILQKDTSALSAEESNFVKAQEHSSPLECS